MFDFFKKKEAVSTAKADKSVSTIIGDAISLTNVTVKGIGSIRIDGSVTGQVELEGHLMISRGGKLEGEVKASSATISGSYKGDISITGTLHLTPHAHVVGRIQAGKMVVDEGAGIRAACFANKEGDVVVNGEENGREDQEETENNDVLNVHEDLMHKNTMETAV